MAQVVQRRPGAQEPEAQRPTRRDLPWPIRFVNTTVGMKWVMALSGIMLIGFIVFHMIGNWKMFLGNQAINHYGEFLRELLYPILPRTVFLWIMRIGLIGAFLVHILAAYRLVLLNKKARPVNYQSKRNYIAANYANRTMAVSGTIVLAYLLFHLADLTWGVSGVAGKGWQRGMPYENFVASMSRPPVAIFYIIANLLLAVHLYHGAWSMFQSLGLNSPKYNVARRYFAIGLAVLIGVGNSIMPLAAMLNIVK